MSTFADVRRIAMSLPEAEEKVAWEVDITFRVRDKIFVMAGPQGTHASIKASPDRQAELVDLDPETFAPSAYVGRFGWVTVDLARVDDPLLEDLIRDAWRRTAPKRLAATLEGTR
jgi:predicted DNA-binding protein (MmcQ/YjbR family)